MKLEKAIAEKEKEKEKERTSEVINVDPTDPDYMNKIQREKNSNYNRNRNEINRMKENINNINDDELMFDDMDDFCRWLLLPIPIEQFLMQAIYPIPNGP